VSEYKLMRIMIGEKKKINGEVGYKYIIKFLMKNRIAGATAIRGILGYGSSFKLHSASILSLSEDLPIIIEVVDKKENLKKVIPQIRDFLEGKGLITLEDVEVIP